MSEEEPKGFWLHDSCQRLILTERAVEPYGELVGRLLGMTTVAHVAS